MKKMILAMGMILTSTAFAEVACEVRYSIGEGGIEQYVDSVCNPSEYSLPIKNGTKISSLKMISMVSDLGLDLKVVVPSPSVDGSKTSNLKYIFVRKSE